MSYKLLRIRGDTLPLGLFLTTRFVLPCSSSGVFNPQDQTLAQHYNPTIKYRNLVIDLGKGVKTYAHLTYPALGKGPLPGVLFIHGSGTVDKNETIGLVHKNGPKPAAPFGR